MPDSLYAWSLLNDRERRKAATRIRNAHLVPGRNADLPQEGCDRCPCGCKYWNGKFCVDCGDKFVREDT